MGSRLKLALPSLWTFRGDFSSTVSSVEGLTCLHRLFQAGCRVAFPIKTVSPVIHFDSGILREDPSPRLSEESDREQRTGTQGRSARLLKCYIDRHGSG